MVKYRIGVNYLKLNYDCIRDVLLVLEENLTIEVEETEDGAFYSYNYLDTDDVLNINSLSKYSKYDIIYSVVKLSEACYINTSDISGDDLTEFIISDITYSGHEFLQSIKSETVWNDVKNVSKKVGSMSFPIISSIAGNVISKIITTSMGIT